MHSYPVSRRTQCSSCDACRQSRVACDASKLGYQPGQASWGGSCSRCALRHGRCTFEVQNLHDLILLPHSTYLCNMWLILCVNQWIKRLPRKQRPNSRSQAAPLPRAQCVHSNPHGAYPYDSYDTPDSRCALHRHLCVSIPTDLNVACLEPRRGPWSQTQLPSMTLTWTPP